MNARLKTWIHDEHHFRTMVTLLLAGLTFVTSFIVVLNVRASGRGAAATRDGRLLGIQYLTAMGRSLWDVAVEKDLVSNYQEASGLIMLAQVNERMAGLDANASFYKMMADVLARSRALLIAQGEITKPAYFAPAYGNFNVLQFILDRVNIPATEIFERQEQKWAEGAFWGLKSNAFSAGLAIMAVAVFLLTLSLVLTAHIRFIMAGVGAALVTGVLAVVGITSLKPWHGHSNDSVALLAKASGSALAAQLYINWNGDTQTAASYAQEARAELDKILTKDPEYWTAVLLSARVHSVLGETQFFAGTGDSGRAELMKASSDLDRAIAGGKTEGYTFSSKGYVNFLLGRHEAALAAMDRALALLPDRKFALGLVKAVALLYSGRIAEARALTEESIEFALKKPLGTDTMDIRTIIKNLERFNELKPAESLPEMIVRLKEGAVCLAFLNKTRPAEVKSFVSPPQFVAPVYDGAGAITATPATEEYKRGTGRADFFLELKDMEKGQRIVRKAYHKAPGQVFWIEQPWLGRDEPWNPASGDRLMRFVENRIPEAGEFLFSGDYRLEIFVEGKLLASGGFKVL
jgi:tetratricopeptide (TPR) repeat protein